MEAYEASAEEVADRKTAAPAVVVGVGDNEAREHEEEIDGQVAVVDAFYCGAAAGKGVPSKMWYQMTESAATPRSPSSRL